MAYVNVPKDLSKVKTKVMFNLTKRQLVCFGTGGLIGVPLFFLLKSYVSTSMPRCAWCLSCSRFSCWQSMKRTASPLKRSFTAMCRCGLSAPSTGPIRPTISMPC